MIICHNVCDNKIVFLEKIIQIHENIPEIESIIVSYNNIRPNIKTQKPITYLYHGPNTGWQSSPVRAMINICTYAKEHKIEKIIFSHEDTHIRNIKTVTALYSLLETFDFICRKPAWEPIVADPDYYMIDCCFLGKRAIDVLSDIKDFNTINDASSAENYIGSIMNNNNISTLYFEYNPPTHGITNLGFHHNFH